MMAHQLSENRAGLRSLRPDRSNSSADTAELTAALADGTLLGYPGAIEIRETHASVVFLTPSEVYKLKKPVDLGFLNYSTLQRRAKMCRLELSLNRRLAPDAYLGVERVTREKAGHLRLNGSDLRLRRARVDSFTGRFMESSASCVLHPGSDGRETTR